MGPDCAPMYTSSLWCKLKKYSLKSITVAYNNSLRILLNLPSRCSASFMFATNYIKSFNERIRSSIFSLLCRLHQSDNIRCNDTSKRRRAEAIYTDAEHILVELIFAIPWLNHFIVTTKKKTEPSFTVYQCAKS